MLYNSDLPVYIQIYQLLKQNIISGKWKQSATIPPEKLLAKEYGVARGTVRSAILRLVSDGYLYRKRGVGTYVYRTKPVDEGNALISYTDSLLLDNVKVKGAVIESKMYSAKKPESEKLQLHKGDMVNSIKIVYKVNLNTIIVETAYVDSSQLTDNLKHRLTESNYKELLFNSGIVGECVKQIIRTEPVDEKTGEELSISAGKPVLVIERLAYAKYDKPLLWQILKSNKDICSIKTSIVLKS